MKLTTGPSNFGCCKKVQYHFYGHGRAIDCFLPYRMAEIEGALITRIGFRYLMDDHFNQPGKQ